MRPKNKLFFWALIPLLLTACATGYQKEGIFTNGYSDLKLADDRYVVTFRANEHTPSEKVMEFALKRAAELTLQHGYRYFAILDQVETSKRHLYYPSLRFTIQCFDQAPPDAQAIDAESFLAR